MQTKSSPRNDKKAWHNKIADELELASTCYACNNMREGNADLEMQMTSSSRLKNQDFRIKTSNNMG